MFYLSYLSYCVAFISFSLFVGLKAQKLGLISPKAHLAQSSKPLDPWRPGHAQAQSAQAQRMACSAWDPPSGRARTPLYATQQACFTFPLRMHNNEGHSPLLANACGHLSRVVCSPSRSFPFARHVTSRAPVAMRLTPHHPTGFPLLSCTSLFQAASPRSAALTILSSAITPSYQATSSNARTNMHRPLHGTCKARHLPRISCLRQLSLQTRHFPARLEPAAVFMLIQRNCHVTICANLLIHVSFRCRIAPCTWASWSVR